MSVILVSARARDADDVRTWPEFDTNGDLPVGIHAASLVSVLQHFGSTSPRRRIVGERLERVYELARSTGQLARFVVFGSFVTRKPDPNDVDVFMIMKDSFDVSEFHGETAAVFDHTAAQNALGASVFWIRRLAVMGSEEEALEYWQTKRDKTLRGIVEVIDDDSE